MYSVDGNTDLKSAFPLVDTEEPHPDTTKKPRNDREWRAWREDLRQPSELPKEVLKALNWESSFLNIVLFRARVRFDTHFGSSMVIVVKDCIVSSKEYITKDPVAGLSIIDNAQHADIFVLFASIFSKHVVEAQEVIVHQNFKLVVINPE